MADNIAACCRLHDRSLRTMMPKFGTEDFSGGYYLDCTCRKNIISWVLRGDKVTKALTKRAFGAKTKGNDCREPFTRHHP